MGRDFRAWRGYALFAIAGRGPATDLCAGKRFGVDEIETPILVPDLVAHLRGDSPAAAKLHVPRRDHRRLGGIGRAVAPLHDETVDVMQTKL